MANFTRGGKFEDREAFLLQIKEKISRLRSGPLSVMTEKWEQTEGADVATLSGFGVVVTFRVGQEEWHCEGAVPDWLPIPPDQIEARFDQEFADLTESA